MPGTLAAFVIVMPLTLQCLADTRNEDLKAKALRSLDLVLHSGLRMREPCQLCRVAENIATTMAPWKDKAGVERMAMLESATDDI